MRSFAILIRNKNLNFEIVERKAGVKEMAYLSFVSTLLFIVMNSFELIVKYEDSFRKAYFTSVLGVEFV
jgi:hypothetical protein